MECFLLIVKRLIRLILALALPSIRSAARAVFDGGLQSLTLLTQPRSGRKNLIGTFFIKLNSSRLYVGTSTKNVKK